MYFPYLRGRQFELIALRDLVEKGVLSDKIIPIIEPVKLSSTLIKTIELYGKKGRELGIIVNPKVGGFKIDMEEEKNQKLKNNLVTSLKENDYILYMILLSANLHPDNFIKKHEDNMGTICILKNSK